MLGESVTGGGFDEGRNPGLVEPGQREALHALDAAQVGQQLDQRMPATDLAIPIRGDGEEAERFGGTQNVPQ